VPGGIFHIVGVDRPVKLELAATVVVSPGVVEGKAPLPEPRREVGSLLDQGVEKLGRRCRFFGKEQLDGLLEQLLRRVGWPLGGRRWFLRCRWWCRVYGARKEGQRGVNQAGRQADSVKKIWRMHWERLK